MFPMFPARPFHLPSGVDAEKLSGVGFHQSCPYRDTRMGVVKNLPLCRTYFRSEFREFKRFCHEARRMEGKEAFCMRLQPQLHSPKFVFISSVTRKMASRRNATPCDFSPLFAFQEVTPRNCKVRASRGTWGVVHLLRVPVETIVAFFRRETVDQI